MSKDVVTLAREASAFSYVKDADSTPHLWAFSPTELERLVELVRADEREACEVLYTHEDVQAPVGNSAWGEAYQDGWIAGAQAYRDAIRARSNT